MEDDISKLALLNKNNEKKVIEEEIAKYNVYYERLDGTKSEEEILLQNLEKYLSAYENERKSDANIETNLGIQGKVLSALQQWSTLRSFLNEGEKFYSDLQSSLQNLSCRIETAIQSRRVERETKEREMISSQTQRGNDYLRNEILQRKPLPHPSFSSYPPNPHPQQPPLPPKPSHNNSLLD